MGDDDQRLITRQFSDGGFHLLLILRIGISGRFVENDDRRILENGASERDPLALTAAEHLPRVSGRRVNALRQSREKFCSLCFISSSEHLVLRRIRTTEANILKQ